VKTAKAVPIRPAEAAYWGKWEKHVGIPLPYWPPFRSSDISAYWIFCDIVIRDGITNQIGKYIYIYMYTYIYIIYICVCENISKYGGENTFRKLIPYVFF